MLIALTIAIFCLIFSFLIVRNLYRKNLKYEELIRTQAQYMREVSAAAKKSYAQLLEIDNIGAFQADDEVGSFFTTLKGVYEQLDSITVDENYGK